MSAAVFPRDSAEFGRALGFIDAIFGFSMTLLVTTLDVPPMSAWTDMGALMNSGLGPQLLAFGISFAVVAGFWRANHAVIATFSGLDNVTLRLCIYVVAAVVLIPFSTEAVSEPNPDNLPLPTTLYAGNVAAVVLLSALLITVARARGLSRDERPLLRQTASALTVAAVFLVSIPVAYRFGPTNAKWCWLSLVVLSPLADRITRPPGSPTPG